MIQVNQPSSSNAFFLQVFFTDNHRWELTFYEVMKQLSLNDSALSLHGILVHRTWAFVLVPFHKYWVDTPPVHYCHPQSLCLWHPCFWAVVASLSSIQEVVLYYTSGWCLSIFFLWECSPGDNHWSALFFSIQHGSEFLCLVL